MPRGLGLSGRGVLEVRIGLDQIIRSKCEVLLRWSLIVFDKERGMSD